MKLDICIHCHRYQRRLCWMLSSILQQKGDIPEITVRISHSENDGEPTTREVCDFFRSNGLKIEESILTDDQVKNRAIGRNIQVSETKADWILFVDSDMVYDPLFFEDLKKQLSENLKDEKKVMGADRVSLDIPFCIKYFEEDERKYPCIVPDVASITEKWPIKWVTGGKTAPGNFQLANVPAIMDKGGKYTGREGDVWRRTKSDRAFRCRMGGRVRIRTKKQYHLNHDRGGPDIQR